MRVEVEDLIDGYAFNEMLTRARFEELCGDLFKRTLAPLERVLADVSTRALELDRPLHLAVTPTRCTETATPRRCTPAGTPRPLRSDRYVPTFLLAVMLSSRDGL